MKYWQINHIYTDVQRGYLPKLVVFGVLNGYFDKSDEYRIVNIKDGPKHFADRGAHLYVEIGETIPTLTGA